jgi:hypothetical protein
LNRKVGWGCSVQSEAKANMAASSTGAFASIAS